MQRIHERPRSADAPPSVKWELVDSTFKGINKYCPSPFQEHLKPLRVALAASWSAPLDVEDQHRIYKVLFEAQMELRDLPNGREKVTTEEWLKVFAKLVSRDRSRNSAAKKLRKELLIFLPGTSNSPLLPRSSIGSNISSMAFLKQAYSRRSRR
jgi:hypothetical protein